MFYTFISLQKEDMGFIVEEYFKNKCVMKMTFSLHRYKFIQNLLNYILKKLNKCLKLLHHSLLKDRNISQFIKI